MELNRFNAVIKEQLRLCEAVLVIKGDEYVLADDRLGPFKKAAIFQNETPKQALLGMLTKHLVSISNMCISGIPSTQEKWDEKITDSINYFLLLSALVKEELGDEQNRN